MLRPADGALGVGDDVEQARPRACDRGAGARCSGAGRGSRRSGRWRAATARAPARGRSRSGCCRRAPSAARAAGRRRRGRARPCVRGVYTAAAGRIRACRPPPSPPPTTSLAVLRGVIDPELGSDIVELGHGQGRPGRARRRRRRHDRPHHRRLPAAGPDPARRARPGGVAARRHPRHARLDRDDAGGEVLRHGQGALERRPAPRGHRRSRPPPRWCSSASGKGGVGQVVGHGQPGRRAGGHRPHRRRARRRHLGLLRAADARGLRSPRRRGARRQEADDPARAGRRRRAAARSSRWASSWRTRSRR